MNAVARGKYARLSATMGGKIPDLLPVDATRAAADDIKDNLRYTYTVNPESYGESVNTILSGLDDMGYERVNVKNFWNKTDGYTGVHGLYRTPDGQLFEVQFHTDQTLVVKELISHPLYEVQRDLPTDVPEWFHLQVQIDNAWRVIRDDPPDLGGLP